ncbi:hypothetical protein ONE63_000083 [Megalurothrips usitatus]|uniref:Uncharacterized protein n=1 Tax=Megalurothrips usitatus TaxID=439358 RepID=A0AAV7XYE8_9NEOP|nr:hypothetical protein ONE63_000083 [Megalurothrips usitatus]
MDLPQIARVLQPTALVAEIPSMQGCPDVAGNAVVFLGPATNAMRGRGNYTFSAAFNVTRTVHRVAEIRMDITRCREVVSSNTCEHFHSWRLQRNACRAWMDTSAPWAELLKAIPEDYDCPTRTVRVGCEENPKSRIDASVYTVGIFGIFSKPAENTGLGVENLKSAKEEGRATIITRFGN